MNRILLFVVCSFCITLSNAQSLMPKINDEEIAELLNKPAIIALPDGSKVSGTLANVNLLKGNLTTVSLKLDDGTKQKFKPGEIESLKVRLLKPIKFSVVDENGNTVRDLIATYIVYDHPYQNKKTNKVKPDMMQILNPGFDSRIKVYADPNSTEGYSISIKGDHRGGTAITSYMMIKDDEITYVKSSTYKNNFNKVFGDCQEFMDRVPADQIVLEGLGGHVLLYDHHCKAQ